MNNLIELSTGEVNHDAIHNEIKSSIRKSTTCSISGDTDNLLERNNNKNVSDSESTIKSMSADSSSTTSIVSDDSLPSYSDTRSSTTDSSNSGTTTVVGYPMNTTTSFSFQSGGHSTLLPHFVSSPGINHSLSSTEGLAITESKNTPTYRKSILKHTVEPIFITQGGNDIYNSPSFSVKTLSTATIDNNSINNTVIHFSPILEEAGKHSPPPKKHHHNEPKNPDNNSDIASSTSLSSSSSSLGTFKPSRYPSLSSSSSSSTSSLSTVADPRTTKIIIPTNNNDPSIELLPPHHYHTTTATILLQNPEEEDSIVNVTERMDSSFVNRTVTTSSSSGTRTVRIAAQADVYVYTPRTITSEPSDTEISPIVPLVSNTHTYPFSSSVVLPHGGVLIPSKTMEPTLVSFPGTISNTDNLLTRQVSASSIESTSSSSSSSSSTLSSVSESSNSTNSECSVESTGPPLGLRIRTRTTAHQELHVPSTENPYAVSPEKAGKPHHFNLRRSLSGLGRYSDDDNNNNNVGSIARSTSEPVSLPSHPLSSPPGKRHYNEAFFGPSTRRCTSDGARTIDSTVQNRTDSFTQIDHHHHKRRETVENSVVVHSPNGNTSNISSSFTEKVSLTISSPSRTDSSTSSDLLHPQHQNSRATSPPSNASSTGLTPSLQIIQLRQ